MLTGELGVRLFLMLGKSVVLPAPAPIAAALAQVEVTCDEREADTFQLTFTMAKDGPEYGVLKSGLLDAFNRVAIGVFIGACPQVLINGVITHTQLTPGDGPGRATITVTGDDLSTLMDAVETNRRFPNLPDSGTVGEVLKAHAGDGIVAPHVIAPTTQVRSDAYYIQWQYQTDLAFVRGLAEGNGFVFYLEPMLPGFSRAYWGPSVRTGIPQPALTVDMGAATTVRSLRFVDDARAPIDVDGRVLLPVGKTSLPIPKLPPARPPLSAAPAPARRRVLLRGTAKHHPADAAARAVADITDAEDPVIGTGELDTVRYGHVLQPRRLVGVRGAGLAYDGLYHVRQVTHVLSRGSYTQRFSIARDGRGSLVGVVRP